MSKYLDARRCCDLVMKGGVTSGIVYPPAICRIAESFYLVGIGGASAGAIAACLAAAAEYRRRQYEDARGFELLDELPWEIAEEGKLAGLFRPDQQTGKLYRLVIDALALGKRSWWGRTSWKIRFLWALLNRKKHLQSFINGDFGLCTGMARGRRRGKDDVAPLTEWLTEKIDRLAGKDDGDPLTFGDLRHAKIPEMLVPTMEGMEKRSIDLRVVTTCLSFGRPYELPFQDDLFAFDPEEWEPLFPRKVLDYLFREAKKIKDSSREREGKLPLPSGDKMPIVVAARMSLSFPGLFSMIPLYAVNYDAPKGSDGDSPMRKVWFSDGGITSNLPIHRFDVLFPRWPTLGINLQYTDKKGRPARNAVDGSLVYMIQRRSDGTRDLWHVFDDDEDPPEKNVLGFSGAVFRSAQVWHDHGYLRLPGYRDRIVEIWLRPDEGGFNIDMERKVIERLIERGDVAGRRIRERFDTTPCSDSLSWEGHRWTRLRSGMSGLARFLHAFRHNVEHPLPGDRTLSELLEERTSPPAYKFRHAQFEGAKKGIFALLDYIAALDDAEVCAGEEDRPFCGRPRPKVEIGSRAPM